MRRPVAQGISDCRGNGEVTIRSILEISDDADFAVALSMLKIQRWVRSVDCPENHIREISGAEDRRSWSDARPVRPGRGLTVGRRHGNRRTGGCRACCVTAPVSRASYNASPLMGVARIEGGAARQETDARHRAARAAVRNGNHTRRALRNATRRSLVKNAGPLRERGQEAQRGAHSVHFRPRAARRLSRNFSRSGAGLIEPFVNGLEFGSGGSP